MVEITLKAGIRYSSASEFYPFYLTQHRNKTCRRLHFVGTTGSMAIIAWGLLTQTFPLIPLGIVFGYAMAWVGHFFFEKNKPATFQYPLFSFICDFYMWYDIATGKIRF